jgi:hypothetical protein
LSHNDSSRSNVGQGVGGRRAAALSFFFVATWLVLGIFAVGSPVAFAQTPGGAPSDPGQQPGQTQPQPQTGPTQQPTQQPTPSPAEQLPLQQEFQIQQPGRPPITPATPPSTTIPPWTPPTPPAPSQTNVPAPFPYPGGAPGAPGVVGIPNLVIPGAFGGRVTTVRGATLEFHPTARVSEEYSDNFFLTTSHTQENFRSIFGPGFVLLLNGARTFGTFATTIDLVHDTAPNSGDEVKVFPSLHAAIRYALTPRLGLTLSDTFIRNDQPQIADQFGIRRGRQTFDTNTLGLSVDWLLDRVATQAYYRNVLFFNENEGQNNLTSTNQGNSVTHILGVNASTRIATDYAIRGGYEFSRTDATGGGSVGTDNTSHTVFAAVSRQFGLYTTGGLQSSFSFQTEDSTKIWNASIFGAYGLPTGPSISASVGYSLLNSDTQDNEGTVSANVTASYRFARAVVSVGVFQDFRQTAQQGQNFGTVETRSYFGSFLYQITPFINTTLHVTYSENSPTGTGNNQNAGTQKQLNYGAGLNWLLLRWLTASLQYNYTKQTGNTFSQPNVFGSGDFAENRATLSLFATF